MMGKKAENRAASVKNVVISALVILFFLAVIFAYYVMLYTATREKITGSCELSSVSSADKIDKYLSKGIDTLKLVSYTLDNMIRSDKSQKEIYDFLVAQSAAVGNITSANSTGVYGYIRDEYLDGTDWVPGGDYVPTERPWYIGARASVGRVAVVDPYVDAQTHTVTITFSKTLCDGKSVVAMDFSLEQLQEITEDAASQSESEVEIVLDRKYQVIAHSIPPEVGKNYMEETGTFGGALVEKLRVSDQGFFSMSHDGKDYVVYSVPVADDWLCLSVFDATSVFGQLRLTLIFTGVASLLVVLVLLLILVRSNRKQERYNRMSHVVEALAAAIDAKDAYTNGHSGRVADYAREISRRHGYSERKQNEIHMMGLLHDVGKIGVPDAVINKPGRLTEEEYETIKTHSAIGADILSKATGMPGAAVVAHWHHERFDGTGYPDKLAGKKIPEEARIVAVADAYDAMTSRRSYRDALPQYLVRSEIERGKGTQFDPVFADIMLQMIDDDKDFVMHGQ